MPAQRRGIPLGGIRVGVGEWLLGPGTGVLSTGLGWCHDDGLSVCCGRI